MVELQAHTWSGSDLVSSLQWMKGKYSPEFLIQTWSHCELISDAVVGYYYYGLGMLWDRQLHTWTVKIFLNKDLISLLSVFIWYYSVDFEKTLLAFFSFFFWKKLIFPLFVILCYEMVVWKTWVWRISCGGGWNFLGTHGGRSLEVLDHEPISWRISEWDGDFGVGPNPDLSTAYSSKYHLKLLTTLPVFLSCFLTAQIKFANLQPQSHLNPLECWN